MPSNLRLSNRLSSFRFSLASIGPLRSPVSPLTPQSPPHTFQHGRAKATSSSSSSPTIVGAQGVDEKTPGMAVTIIERATDNHVINKTLLSPPPTARPLLSPARSHSPITPWHATFHRNAASTSHETQYLLQTRSLRHARTLITICLLLPAVVVTSLASDILHRYIITDSPTSSLLALWPHDLNLTPSLLQIVTGSLTLLLSLVTLVVHVLPSPNPRTQLSNSLFGLLTLICAVLSLSTLATSSVSSPFPIFSDFITPLLTATGPHSTSGLSVSVNSKAHTIQSYTCNLAYSATSFTDSAKSLQLPYPSDASHMIPSGFQRICVESFANSWLLIAMCVIAALGVGITAWTWNIERSIERLRGEREVIASAHGSRDGSSDLKQGTRVVEMGAFVEKRDV